MGEYTIKVPPDSTGKGIRHQVLLEVDYVNLTGTFPVGALVTFGTSTTEGTVLRVHSGTFHTEPHMHILLTHGSPEAVTLGEDIIVDGVKQAEVAGQTAAFYNPVSIAVGGNNPLFAQHIDSVGASKVRYHEGSPTFDAFGAQQASKKHKLADYVMSYDALPQDFTDTSVGSGAYSYIHATKGVTLSTGTPSGDSIGRTSNRYHRYQPGISQLVMMTCAAGDTGKAGVTRSWGYYDVDNGLGFSLVDTTLNIRLRSKVTGSVVDTYVAQENWNEDTLDGSGDAFNPSGFSLDTSKNNLYWFDFQWLGAGTVRYGVYADGRRITCHSMLNANENTTSYMSTGTLPITYEQINTGISASTSEFKFYCATVITEGEHAPSLTIGTKDLAATTNGTTPVHVMSIRPKQVFKGEDNRNVLSFEGLQCHNSTDKAVYLRIGFNATVTGGAWADNGTESSIEYLSGASAITQNAAARVYLVPPNGTVDVKDTAETEMFRNSDITTSNTVDFSVEQTTVGTAGEVFLVINWNEIRD